jgi:hypothetical protein
MEINYMENLYIIGPSLGPKDKTVIVSNLWSFVSGTHGLGNIETTYKSLVAAFGKPNDKGDEYKIDAEWVILTPVGIATIYNWKDGKNYCGKDGLPVSKITDWHVGGHNLEVIEYLTNAINK